MKIMTLKCIKKELIKINPKIIIDLGHNKMPWVCQSIRSISKNADSVIINSQHVGTGSKAKLYCFSKNNDLSISGHDLNFDISVLFGIWEFNKSSVKAISYKSIK